MSTTKTSKKYELRIKGDLNPAIFTVEWYSTQFGDVDVKGSSTSVPSFVKLGNITITCDYIDWVASFGSEEHCHEAVSVADKVFSQLLSHTPVTEAYLTVYTTFEDETWDSVSLGANGLLANGLIENIPNSQHLYVQWRENSEPKTTTLCWTCSNQNHFHVRHTFEFRLIEMPAIQDVLSDYRDLFSRASISSDFIMNKFSEGSIR